MMYFRGSRWRSI